MPSQTNGIAARHFLLLQGPIGPLFAMLGEALLAAGHGVSRVRFNGGDCVFSGSIPAIDYRQDAEQWIDFLDRLLLRHGVTDLVLFGDCRPLHRLAVDHARRCGLDVHVFEEGYLRPGWVTLERGGVNGYSSLPVSPGTYLASSGARTETLPAAMSLRMPFFQRAIEDVIYTLASAMLWPLYPGYRTHKPWSPLTEYRAGARRFFARSSFRAAAAAVAAELLARQRRFFLFPLQLDSDAQIRVHSEFGSMSPAIEAVVHSFAHHAAADTLLVISEHPLDQAVVNLHAVVRRAAAAAGISGRVLYLRGGTPPPLVAASLGLVTVNSTIALSALDVGRPVAALGRAVYRIAGLVHSGPLETFWQAPPVPDAALFAAFKGELIRRTQLPGGFYSPAARQRVVQAALPRLLAASAGLDAESASRQRPPPAIEDRYATAAE